MVVPANTGGPGIWPAREGPYGSEIMGAVTEEIRERDEEK